MCKRQQNVQIRQNTSTAHVQFSTFNRKCANKRIKNNLSKLKAYSRLITSKADRGYFFKHFSLFICDTGPVAYNLRLNANQKNQTQIDF